MKTFKEILKKHWEASPGYSPTEAKDFEEFINSKEFTYLENAVQEYANQFKQENHEGEVSSN